MNLSSGDTLLVSKSSSGSASGSSGDVSCSYGGTGSSFSCTASSGQDGENTYLWLNSELIATITGGKGGEGGRICSSCNSYGNDGFKGETGLFSSVSNVIVLETTAIETQTKSEIEMWY